MPAVESTAIAEATGAAHVDIAADAVEQLDSRDRACDTSRALGLAARSRVGHAGDQLRIGVTLATPPAWE